MKRYFVICMVKGNYGFPDHGWWTDRAAAQKYADTMPVWRYARVVTATQEFYEKES